MEEFLNYLNSLQGIIQESKIVDRSESLHEYSEKLNCGFKTISEDVTKLCMACGNDNIPEIELITPLMLRLQNSINNLVSIYLSTPNIFGKFSHIFLKENIFLIFKNLQEIVKSIFKGDGSHRSTLGQLWNQVDNFVSVKKTNSSIILIKLNESNKLLNDAVSELHHEIQDHSTSNTSNGVYHDDDDDDDDESDIKWSRDEIIMVNAVYGILKTTQATCSKLIKVISSNEEIGDCYSLLENDYIGSNSTSSFSVGTLDAFSDLDEICEYVIGLSQIVDEVISNLYAPIEKDVLHKQVLQLNDLINEILSKSRCYNFMNEEDINRFEFLEKALSHNYNKFNLAIKQ